MRAPVLVLLLVGGRMCAADHLRLKRDAWVHRRGILDILDPNPDTTSALPATSATSPGLLGLLLADPTPTPTPTPSPATSSTEGGATPSTPSSGPTPTPSPATSSTEGGGLLGDLLGPSSTPSSSDAGPTPSPVLGILDPNSDTTSALPATSSTSPGLLGLLLDPTPSPATSSTGGDLLGPSSTPTPTPAPSSTEGGGLLGNLLSTPPPAPSSTEGGGLLGNLLSTPPPDSSTPPPAPPPSTTSTDGLLPILNPILSQSSSDGGGLTSAIPPTSVLLPVPGTDSPPPPSDSPLLSTPIIPIPAPSSDAPPPLSTPIIPIPAPSSDAPPPLSSPPFDPPTPTATPSPVPSTPPPSPPSTEPPVPSLSSPTPTSPPARPLPSNSVSINSDLSFVLTESSLAVASLPTSTATGPNGETLTDPDAATTTVTNTIPPSAVSPSSAFASGSSNSDPSKDSPQQPPLPSGVPSRIYPASQQVDPHASQDDMRKDGYTLISLLFDQKLNWPFVVGSPIASSQIFAYIPPLVSTAIGESNEQVKTLFLQVFIPLSYNSPTDQLDLGTLWVGYIPADRVDTLEAMIKAKQSKFYTAVPIEAARQLAERVKSGWVIRGAVGVGDDSSSGGGSGGGTGGTGGTAGNQQKARRDAIVGVVSSLGAIALLVLVVLIVHSVKRRREMAHRRLADRASSVGSSGAGGAAAAAAAQGEGREFDRDSVGAPRRRSFYFAEDSLRGWEAEREQEREFNEFGASPTSGAGMSQRRVGPVVVPGSISAPILRESSMNW